jgi:nitrogen fixation protein NifB
MLPEEAVAWVQVLREGKKKIRSVELCGPGDVFASSPVTLKCLELLQPEIQGAELSLTCLGPGAADVASDLARFGVKTVTLLVDTASVDTAQKLYDWIRPSKKNVPMHKAAEILINSQAEAVKALTTAGIEVVIRTTVLEGINDEELTDIAKKMAELGVSAMEIEGDEGGDLEKFVEEASQFLPATVFKAVQELPPPGTPGDCKDVSLPMPTKERPNVAVVSTNGMEVDMHLGLASQVLIYGARTDGLPCLLMARKTPESGTGTKRWKAFASECLHDCFALLATHAGDAPRKELAELGIRVVLTEDNIEGLVDVLFGGGKKKKCGN